MVPAAGRTPLLAIMKNTILRAVVEWAFMRTGPGGLVGTMGESMGGAIAIQHAAIDPRLAFCISISSFSDLTQLLIYRFKYEFKLPVFPFLQLADFMTTILSGMSFDAVSPLRDIAEINLPVMLIHGENDRYVPAQMCKDLYEAKKKGSAQFIWPKMQATRIPLRLTGRNSPDRFIPSWKNRNARLI